MRGALIEFVERTTNCRTTLHNSATILPTFSQHSATSYLIMPDQFSPTSATVAPHSASLWRSGALTLDTNVGGAGSKNLYVGRAQKKSERMQFLAQQYEEKRQERIHKYMVRLIPLQAQALVCYQYVSV